MNNDFFLREMTNDLISYDINISSLRTASQSRGGFELSLQYVFAKDPSKNAVPKCYNKF
jgi:hypothetical protein